MYNRCLSVCIFFLFIGIANPVGAADSVLNEAEDGSTADSSQSRADYLLGHPASAEFPEDPMGMLTEEEMQYRYMVAFLLEKDEALYEEALKIYQELRKQLDKEHTLYGKTWLRESVCLYRLKRYDEAELAFREILYAYPPSHVLAKRAMFYLKRTLEDSGKILEKEGIAPLMINAGIWAFASGTMGSFLIADELKTPEFTAIIGGLLFTTVTDVSIYLALKDKGLTQAREIVISTFMQYGALAGGTFPLLFFSDNGFDWKIFKSERYDGTEYYDYRNEMFPFWLSATGFTLLGGIASAFLSRNTTLSEGQASWANTNMMLGMVLGLEVGLMKEDFWNVSVKEMTGNALIGMTTMLTLSFFLTHWVDMSHRSARLIFWMSFLSTNIGFAVSGLSMSNRIGVTGFIFTLLGYGIASAITFAIPFEDEEADLFTEEEQIVFDWKLDQLQFGYSLFPSSPTHAAVAQKQFFVGGNFLTIRF